MVKIVNYDVYGKWQDSDADVEDIVQLNGFDYYQGAKQNHQQSGQTKSI